jgi:acetyl-CoA acetyltransferase
MENQVGKLAGLFAVLAIFISCLGLFGLASYVAKQRTKEIGIRKVLGASVVALWRMLSRDFVVLVILSCFIAIPIALGLKPMARWLSSGAAGVDPRTMGLGPVPATRKALHRAELTLDQIDLAELNEAFAVQSLAVLAELGLSSDITNVNGGAIALGHPLGCSGARILTTLLYEMERRAANGEQMRYGLATLCVGVGQGEATVVEKYGD